MYNVWSDRSFLIFQILMLYSYCRGISQDEKRYPEAFRFMPERFLDVNGALTDDNPAGYVFGFGRRACPGRLSYFITA
jgi:cytochrome P450